MSVAIARDPGTFRKRVTQITAMNYCHSCRTAKGVVSAEGLYWCQKCLNSRAAEGNDSGNLEKGLGQGLFCSRCFYSYLSELQA